MERLVSSIPSYKQLNNGEVPWKMLKNNGVGSIVEYYGHSLKRTLASIYPEHPWESKVAYYIL